MGFWTATASTRYAVLIIFSRGVRIEQHSTYRIPSAINVALADSCSSLLAVHFLACEVFLITSWTDLMILIRRFAGSELASLVM